MENWQKLSFNCHQKPSFSVVLASVAELVVTSLTWSHNSKGKVSHVAFFLHACLRNISVSGTPPHSRLSKTLKQLDWSSILYVYRDQYYRLLKMVQFLYCEISRNFSEISNFIDCFGLFHNYRYLTYNWYCYQQVRKVLMLIFIEQELSFMFQIFKLMLHTVMFLSFRTDRSGQTVQTQITAPRGAVWSGSTLFAIPSALFGLVTLW